MQGNMLIKAHWMLRAFVVAAVCLLLTVAPVFAQGTSVYLPGDITPAGLLVAATALMAVVAGVMGTAVLRVMDRRFAERDAKRAAAAAVEKAERDESDQTAKNNAKLIEGVLILGQAVKESNAAQVEERKGLREMLETKQQAEDGRDELKAAVNLHTDESQTAINAHTDEALMELKVDLGRAVTALEAAKLSADNVVTKDDLHNELAPLVKNIDDALKLLRDYQRPAADAPANGATEPTASTP